MRDRQGCTSCHYPCTIYNPFICPRAINPGQGNRDFSVLHYQGTAHVPIPLCHLRPALLSPKLGKGGGGESLARLEQVLCLSVSLSLCQLCPALLSLGRGEREKEETPGWESVWSFKVERALGRCLGWYGYEGEVSLLVWICRGGEKRSSD